MAAKLFNEFLSDRKRFTKALFERPKSVSDFLIYNEFIENKNIFVNNDGSLGCVFDLKLVEHEPKNGEEIVANVEIMKVLFDLPENCVVQFIHDQMPISVGDPIWTDIEKAYTYPSSVSDRILKDKLRFFKNLCKQDGKYRPLRRRTLVSIKFHPRRKHLEKYKTLLEQGSGNLLREVQSFVSELREFDNILKSIEIADGLNVARLDANELLSVLRLFFNPKSSFQREFTRHNPNVPLSKQIVFNSPSLDHEGISREGLRTRTLTLKNSPHFGVPGAMSGFLKLNFPYRICLNFSIPEKLKVKRSLDFKGFFLEHSPSAETRKLKADLDLVSEKIAHDDRCLQMTFNIIIEGESDEELDRRTRKILSVFKNTLECDAIVEDEIGLGLCLNTLPLMYSADSDFSTQRSIRILQSDAQMFLPIFDSFRGDESNPMQLYLSREKNLVPFSIVKESRSSNHSCVVADTGSGKSAFVLDCVQAYKRLHPDPLIFYVEKRASSKMLCRYFGGEVTEFKIGKEINFSPFRGRFDDEKVTFLSLLILTSVRLTNPSFVSDAEYSSIVSQALKLAYKRKVGQGTTKYVDGDFKKVEDESEVVIEMDDVVDAIGSLHDDKNFNDLEDKLNELTKKLRDFYGDGKYADFFKNGSQTGSKDQSFFVYDLDGLDSDATLQALVTLSIFAEIRRIISLEENKGRSGLIIFEEMGQLGKNNPTAAKYIIDFAETIRKLGFWLISIAPRPENFFTSDAGKAVWESADNYFFMQMKPDSVNYVRKNSEVLNDVSAEIVKSIKTRKDEHAEVFYTNKDGSESGAFMFLRCPIDRWIAPTNQYDAHVAERTFKEVGDAGKTLDRLLEWAEEKQKEKEAQEVAA